VGYFGPGTSSSSRPEHALTWVRADAQPPPGLAPDRRDLAARGPGDPGGESSGSVTAGHPVRGDNREWGQHTRWSLEGSYVRNAHEDRGQTREAIGVA
jgi:hypothetical protein